MFLYPQLRAGGSDRVILRANSIILKIRTRDLQTFQTTEQLPLLMFVFAVIPNKRIFLTSFLNLVLIVLIGLLTSRFFC